MLDYRDLDSAEEIAGRPPITITFSGRKTASDNTRKWSPWSIAANSCALIERTNGTAVVAFGGGTPGVGGGGATGKIYQLSDTQLSDDGAAILSYYTTHYFFRTRRRTIALAALRKQTQTPAQIVRDLPNQIPLPVPLEVETIAAPRKTAKQSASPGSAIEASSLAAGPHSAPDNPQPSQVQTVIPNQDLKPLYDFALDCKSCQAKLSAAQGDLADERTKTAALTKERDAALKAANGGTLWRRNLLAPPSGSLSEPPQAPSPPNPSTRQPPY